VRQAGAPLSTLRGRVSRTDPAEERYIDVRTTHAPTDLHTYHTPTEQHYLQCSGVGMTDLVVRHVFRVE